MSELQHAATQTPGHIFGPPPPHIAFWYGNHYLGETRGHPSNIETARAKVKHTLDMLDPGLEGAGRRNRIPFAGARLYCGEISKELTRAPRW